MSIGRHNKIAQLCRVLPAVQVFLLLTLATLLMPSQVFAAGCNVQTYTDVNGPAHVYVLGACSSGNNAKAGCYTYADSIGWPGSSMCGLANYTPDWSAGWLCGTGIANQSDCRDSSGNPANFYLLNYFFPIYYLTTDASPMAGCDRCNRVSDPVQPSTGAVTTLSEDSSDLAGWGFSRFYDSRNGNSSTLGAVWRHTYDRTVQATYTGATFQPYQQGNPNYSYYYTDVATACATGFNDIRSKVSNWSGVTASYANGVCSLTKSGIAIGTISLKASWGYPGYEGYIPADMMQRLIAMGLPADSSVPVAYDVIRDDGQTIRFSVINGVITAPPSTDLKLIQTVGGYSVTDGNDNVETYGTNGKLLSVASRAGVVQTMSYDASGRLNGVTDNFGHQLTLGYDGQSRLSTVTRQ